MKYALVNLHEDPINDVRFDTPEEAEAAAREEWAAGWEVYVSVVTD